MIVYFLSSSRYADNRHSPRINSCGFHIQFGIVGNMYTRARGSNFPVPLDARPTPPNGESGTIGKNSRASVDAPLFVDY